MSVFEFPDRTADVNRYDTVTVGKVQSVDNGKVYVQISSGDCFVNLRVGSLVAIRGGVGRYIIAMVTRLWRKRAAEEQADDDQLNVEEVDVFASVIPENNGALLALLGALRETGVQSKFTRSMDELPAIDEEVFRIADQNLQRFMNVVSLTSKAAQQSPLHLGHFALDRTAPAYVDGNRLFQRHAALLGSTGSGKSWTVARVLEQASKLDNTCAILFDLHGEYRTLPFAKIYRVAGPGDLATPGEEVLFVPHWLLTYEEMQALFIDGSEQSAHNQSLMVHTAISEFKRQRISTENRPDVLDQFTIDSPIPFGFDDVIARLRELNTEREPGARGGERNGPYYGQFTRLIARLEAKHTDRRYGFMYQAPSAWQTYQALHEFAAKLLGFGNSSGKPTDGIKVVDVSEVPSDVLPIVIGTLTRLIFMLQFWTPTEWRHPILIACDEAHLYLPGGEANSVQRLALQSVERVAKEGRKYGVGLMVISQRPSDVSEAVLSQCNNVIALRLSNPTDQQTVRKLLPESLGPLLQMLPLMEVGEAVVVGDSVLLPARIKVEEPSAKPASHTVDFWDRWGAEISAVPDRFAIAVENMRRQERRAHL